jgi:uncharacterized protein YdaU (DUF1376 family)
MNFYKHYLGDFQRDTGHLSLTERGAYLALIHHYYATENPLPTEHAALCRIAGAHTKVERDAVKSVTRFFEVRNGMLWHKRIEAELEKQVDRCDKNRAIAVAREERKRAELEAKSQHETSTNRAPNVKRSEHDSDHENSTPQNQNQNQNQLNTEEANASSPPSTAPPAKVPKKRASQLPDDFLPNENGLAYAAGRKLDVQAELESFANWHAAKASTMKDWQAAWRSWCDKAVEFGRGGAVQRMRASASAEPAWRTEQKNRTAQAVPGIFDAGQAHPKILEVEAKNVTAIALG